MQTKSRRVLAMTLLAMALAAVAAAFGPIRSQPDQAPTPTIRDLPAVQPVRVGIDPAGTPIIRD